MDTQVVEAPFQTFAVAPQLIESGKTSTRLVKSDVASAGVQVIAAGGETNLHAHSRSDEIWFVLDGQAAFYTTDDRLVATLERHQGVLIPHGTPYWFESAAPENLVIMRFGSLTPGEGPDRRIDVQERQWAVSGEAGGQKREVKLAGARFGEA